MIRYPSYSKSTLIWIEEIPSHWTFTKNRFGFKKYKNEKNQFEDTTVLSLTIKGVKIRKDLSFGRSTDSFIGHKMVEKGDIVFCPRDLDGPLMCGVSEYNGCLSTLYIVDKCNENFNKKFIIYWWRGIDYLVSYFKNFSHGMRYSYNRFQFDEIPLIYPPLSEQNQIVSFLDNKTQKIDELIGKTEQKIKLLKEKRTSLINHCVTKGLNPDVEMKDSGMEWIGEIPSHWNLISLKHLVSTKITDGPHETPKFVNEGIPFLSVESVQNNKLDFNRKRGFISEKTHKEYSKKCKPQRDDVFLVKSGSTTGKSTIVETDEEFNIWSPLCIIRSNKSKVLPKFTFRSLQSFYFRRFIELGWSFGTQPNIGMGVIENIRIIVPPLSEQTQIVEYFDKQTQKIDSTIEKETQRIELLKEYRQSLISEVVTGKIDVRDWNK